MGGLHNYVASDPVPYSARVRLYLSFSRPREQLVFVLFATAVTNSAHQSRPFHPHQNPQGSSSRPLGKHRPGIDNLSPFIDGDIAELEEDVFTLGRAQKDPVIGL